MARKVTMKEYLEWFSLRNRTNDWDALCAYDQAQCNKLLAHEYIEKVHEGSNMPEVNDYFLTGETTWIWISNYLVGAPKLSFENNPDEDGAFVAEANMTMPILGGTKIEVTERVVTSISSYDPLNYPKLFAEKVALKDIVGEINEAGAELDLGSADAQKYPWELDDSRIEHVRRVGGNFFKRKFREAAPENRKFPLGKIAYSNQDYFKPVKFKMRTVMADGGNNVSSANYGNGALEMRIAMQGEVSGGLPGGDWLYPIPSDLPGVDSSLILNSRMVHRDIIGKAIARLFGDPAAEFEEVKDGQGEAKYSVKPSSGGFDIPSISFDYEGKNLRFSGFRLPLYTNDDSRLRVGFGSRGNHFSIGSWSGPTLTLGVSIDGGTVIPFSANMQLEGSVKFSINPDAHRIDVALESLIPVILPADDSALPGWIKPALEWFSGSYNWLLSIEIWKSFVSAFVGAFESLDTFVLHSIIFNSEDAVLLKTVDATHDLVSFGSISPRLTKFTINPAQTTLTPGEAINFTTVPAIPNLKWSARNLDGSVEGAGEMDEVTGAYIAPRLEEIDGTYKRVKITAIGGGDEQPHLSMGLVTVPARSMALNPLIVTCPAQEDGQSQTREFTGHASNGILKWSVIGDGDIPESAGPTGKNVYKAPKKQDVKVTKRSFTIDEVKLLNTTNQQTQSSFVVVTHDKQNLVLTMELEGVHRAKFSAKFSGQDIDPAWKIYPETGAGSIDELGNYESDPGSHHQFVIIAAKASMGDFFLGDNFYIQPLPLAEVPPKPAPEAL